MAVFTGTPPSRSTLRVKQHPLLTFFVLTYAVAWMLWAPAVIFGDSMPGELGFVLVLLGSLVPSTVGIVLVAILYGMPGLRAFLRRLLMYRVGLGWYAAMLALPLIGLLAVGLNMLLGGDAPEMDTTIIGAFVFLAFSIFPGSALGEELGWRGFALPSLQARRSALRASLILGVIWGCWHLPLYLTGSDIRPLGLFLPFVISAIAVSILCTWMYNGTGGSLLVVVLFHATINLPLTLLITPFEDEMAQPLWIFVGLLALAAATVVLATGAANLSRTRAKQAALP
jgi:uncharacterized protein